MKKFIFTFYQRHKLKNYCQPIYAKDYDVARNKMIEVYGMNWGFQYPEEKWKEWEKEAKKRGIFIEKELPPIYCE